MEEYLTSKLLQGGSSDFLNKGREDLLKAQAEVKENENFINFLKNLK